MTDLVQIFIGYIIIVLLFIQDSSLVTVWYISQMMSLGNRVHSETRQY